MNQNPGTGGEDSSESQATEEFKCKECEKLFKRPVIHIAGIDFSRQYCDECVAEYERKEKEEEEMAQRQAIVECRQRWWGNCGLPSGYKLKTFDNFEGQRSILRTVRKWAGDFKLGESRGIPSLIFYSDKPGMGKTHVMAAVVNRIIELWDGGPEIEYKQPIRFESGPSLVRRIRATYNLPPGSTHEREEDVYKNMMGVRLLLLDDVGKERPSDFTRETYWYIIDERLKNNLPVIISSRLYMDSLEDLMGEDTVDRLFGMARGKILEFTGTSYRRRNLQP